MRGYTRLAAERFGVCPMRRTLKFTLWGAALMAATVLVGLAMQRIEDAAGSKGLADLLKGFAGVLFFASMRLFAEPWMRRPSGRDASK